MIRIVFIALLALGGMTTASAGPAVPEHVSHGNFKDVALYRPQGAPRGFVLLLSGSSGWSSGLDRTARALAGDGAMVAGIDTAQLRTVLSKDGGDCVFPDGDLENLSHYLQGYSQLPTYLVPIVIGEGSGGALAYALLAKSTPDVFGAAISLDFCPRLDLGKRACSGGSLRLGSAGTGSAVDLLPGKLSAPWLVLQPAAGSACNARAVRDFVAQVGGGAIATRPLAAGDHGLPQLLAGYRALAVRAHAALPPPPAALTDLPLIEVPASGVGNGTFAIMLSGDGGWAGLDKNIARALAAKGIPVVGFDSLRYFWRKRTPDRLAVDLDRVVRYYAAHWHKHRVVLLGYSQGADVLPFAINRLPPATRAQVAQTVLMGLSDKASFEFHLSSWLQRDDDSGLPILPEARQLRADATLCLYGEDEKESLCPRIPPGHVTSRALPGGHHFDGAYDRLADIILARLARQ